MAAPTRRTGAPPSEAGPRRRARGRRPAAPERPGPFERVFAMVRRIPRGRVMTYGQISRLLGGPLSARAVGWAMHQCPEDVPWHRVVNAAGGCSSDAVGAPGFQRRLLEGEGVRFRPGGGLDLERYRWMPRRRTGAHGDL